jgi:hypothetical protein
MPAPRRPSSCCVQPNQPRADIAIFCNQVKRKRMLAPSGFPLATALARMLEEIETGLATAGPPRRGASASAPSCCPDCSRRGQQSCSRPNRGLNRIGGPAPALRPALRAASERFGRGALVGPAASRFRQPAPLRARGAIRPCGRVVVKSSAARGRVRSRRSSTIRARIIGKSSAGAGSGHVSSVFL